MPTFNDSEGFQLLPDGLYKFTVVKFDQGIQPLGKTAGSTNYKMELKCEPEKGTLCGMVKDMLIDHASTAWKIDCFLKSANATNGLKKGSSFTFCKAEEGPGNPWIDPVGLRGYCSITSEELPPRPGKSPMKVNKIATYHTDKPKLPRERVESNEPEVDWSAEQ